MDPPHTPSMLTPHSLPVNVRRCLQQCVQHTHTHEARKRMRAHAAAVLLLLLVDGARLCAALIYAVISSFAAQGGYVCGAVCSKSTKQLLRP